MKSFNIIFMFLSFLSCSEKKEEVIVVRHIPKAQEAIYATVANEVIEDTLDNFNGDEKASIKEFVTPYKFTKFKVKMYKGKLAAPNFEGNPFAYDKEYVDFITEGCKKNGINFGGKYTIIQKSCGCMCEFVFMVDRSNGEILTNTNMPLPDSTDGRYGFMYLKDSEMIIADSGLFANDKMTTYTDVYGSVPEIYVWKSKRFKKLQ